MTFNSCFGIFNLNSVETNDEMQKIAQEVFTFIIRIQWNDYHLNLLTHVKRFMTCIESWLIQNKYDP
jgi:hypothetical protein